MITSGLAQVKKWVLSFGADAIVLKPPELFLDIAQKLSTAQTLYQDK
jgi:delta-aminolevulinic acid dehydratase/porphobilinogen synthase